MKVLYIGPYSEGATSKMRGEIIKNLLNAKEFVVVDTEKILNGFNRIIKSIAFRYKTGPVIKEVNRAIQNQLHNHYDLIWVDKGIFITKETTKKLKEHTGNLVHFTPDPAFLYHKSRHFTQSINLFDYCITTKSYEKIFYKNYGCRKLIFTTQGYDNNIHKPYHNFEDKSGICFIGHHEDNREKFIEHLFFTNLEIIIAGIGWDRFANKHKYNPKLKYIGKGIFGIDYAKSISSSLFGLGLLSKLIPELHTTRTFEIPACKTILCTEKNEETSKFFKDDEVIFYKDEIDLVTKIGAISKNIDAMKDLCVKGYNRVINDGYDYESIMKKLLLDIGLL